MRTELYVTLYRALPAPTPRENRPTPVALSSASRDNEAARVRRYKCLNNANTGAASATENNTVKYIASHPGV